MAGAEAESRCISSFIDIMWSWLAGRGWADSRTVLEAVHATSRDRCPLLRAGQRPAPFVDSTPDGMVSRRTRGRRGLGDDLYATAHRSERPGGLGGAGRTRPNLGLRSAARPAAR